MSVQSNSQDSKEEYPNSLNENVNTIKALVELCGRQSILLKEIRGVLIEIKSDIDRFKPLVEQYETASKAGSFLKQRKILREGLGK